MSRTYSVLLAIPAALALAGCINTAPPPQASTVVVQPSPPQVAAGTIVAPTWVPGHWEQQLTGSYVWVAGHWSG